MKYLGTVIVLLVMFVGCKKGNNGAPDENNSDNAAAEASDGQHRRHDHAWNRDGGLREHRKDQPTTGSN